MARDHKRRLLKLLVLCALAPFLLGLPKTAADDLLLVGTYTRDEGWVNGTGRGVHAFALDPTSGKLTALGATAVGVNPTFLTGGTTRAIARRRVFYAVNEIAEPSTDRPGQRTGFVYAVAASTGTRPLEILNRVESGGGAPCHVSQSPDGAFVTVANYGGGSVGLLPVLADGRLGALVDVHAYNATGAPGGVPGRQDSSHMHSMTWLRGADDDGDDGVVGADLGNDRLVQFALDRRRQRLVPNAAVPFVPRPRGSGPRHTALHPKQRVAYVLDELRNTIGVYVVNDPRNDNNGSSLLDPAVLQTISTLPSVGPMPRPAYSAELAVSHDGRFLYASVRGLDSLAHFGIAPGDGRLTLRGHTPTRGRSPRSFVLHRDLLLVANQDSDNVVVFRIDATTGAPGFTGHVGSCGTPASLLVLPGAH